MANDEAATPVDDCTRTLRVTRGRVKVLDGQHLHYFISVQGSAPVFSLSCTHKTHFSADDFLPPKPDYEVVWPRDSADEEPSQDGEHYTFSMSFAAALKYTLRVELHDSDHNLVGDDDGIIVDADYESEDPEMFCNESWRVRTKA